MNIILYTKPGCPACIQAKSLLHINSMPYSESVIGEDILREDFAATFPDVRSAPFIVIDGVRIGGYAQLREFVDNRPQFLAG